MTDEWWLLGSFITLLFLALLVALYPFRKSLLSKTLLMPLLCFFVAFAYWRWGAWPEWQHYLQQQTKQQQVEMMLQSVKSPQVLIDKLKERLAQQPNSARGWYLLGRLYASQGQWSNAREAFLGAYRLKPQDEAIKINYAQSLWQLNHQAFNTKIRDLFLSVLSNNENQPDALAMLAMDSFMGNAYQQAIEYWQRLLKLTPAQSEEATAIRKAIAKAQQKLS